MAAGGRRRRPGATRPVAAQPEAGQEEVERQHDQADGEQPAGGAHRRYGGGGFIGTLSASGEPHGLPLTDSYGPSQS